MALTVKGNNLLKSLAIILTVSVSIIGYIVYKSSSNDVSETNNIEISQVDVAVDRKQIENTSGQLGKVSPEFQKSIDVYNKEKAEIAKENKTSFIPVITLAEDVKPLEEKPKEVVQAEKAKTEAALGIVQQPVVQPKPPMQQTNMVKTSEQRSAPMYTEQQIKNRVDLLNKILASGSVAGSDGFYYKPVQSGNISSTPVPIQTATSDEYMDEESMLDKIVVGGTMCTAEIISLINTDNKDSVILSKILGGSKDCDKVKGGLIEGQATISSGMDGAILKFSNIKTKKYGYLPVKAIALNQKTSTSVLEGDVDHHILSRYVAPFFFAGLDFAGQAAMRSGSTVTTGVAGMTQSQAPLTDAQMLDVMLGGGARAVSQQLRQDINRTPPVTVTIDPKELQEQKIITVYFLNDLTEKDILKTNNSINMNNGGN